MIFRSKFNKKRFCLKNNRNMYDHGFKDCMIKQKLVRLLNQQTKEEKQSK